ncbi:MAG TPA: ribose ABC transporter permease [Candidatus Atribacteria bacterium]|nr:ribose ABC transporter permease [Candidatus Atribacteria bacterium]
MTYTYRGEGKKLKLLNKFGLFLLLIVIVIIMSFLSPRFLTFSNIINILRQSSINGIIACGMTLVILTSGIDLSVGAILAFSTIIAALLVKSGLSAFISIILALVAGGILGTVNGSIIAYLKVPAFIVTLGMMGIARGFSLIISKGAPITGFPDSFRFLGTGILASIPIPVIIGGVIFFMSWFLVENTVFGMWIRSIGSNRVASKFSGIPLKKTEVLAYTFSGIFSALSGIILIGRLNSAQPTAGIGYEFGAIAAVVLGGTRFTGGKGKIMGTLIGVLILGVIDNSINILNISPFYEQIIKGSIIALALLIYNRTQAQEG